MPGDCVANLREPPLIVRPPEITDFGEMLVIVTGPTTHQSPLAYWPTCWSFENVQVMANRLTEVAAVARSHSGAAKTAQAVSNSQGDLAQEFKIILISVRVLMLG